MLRRLSRKLIRKLSCISSFLMTGRSKIGCINMDMRIWSKKGVSSNSFHRKNPCCANMRSFACEGSIWTIKGFLLSSSKPFKYAVLAFVSSGINPRCSFSLSFSHCRSIAHIAEFLVPLAQAPLARPRLQNTAPHMEIESSREAGWALRNAASVPTN